MDKSIKEEGLKPLDGSKPSPESNLGLLTAIIGFIAALLKLLEAL